MRIEVNNDSVGISIIKLHQLFNNLSEPLEAIKMCAYRKIFSNFYSSGARIGLRWAPLRESTLELRLRRGSSSTLTLIDRGTMLRAATGAGPGSWSSKTANSVTIGVSDSMPWAQYLTEGVPNSLLRVFGRKTKSAFIPPRPFFLLVDSDKEDFVDIIEGWIERRIGKISGGS